MNDEQIKALWLRVTGFDADGDAADIIGFARALLADGGKGEAAAYMYAFELDQMTKGQRSMAMACASPGGAYQTPLYTAPQAECAPREAELHTVFFGLVDAITQNVQVTPASQERDALKQKGLAALLFGGPSSEDAAPTPERAQPISDAMMDLVDRLGSEAYDVDPRAWKHLLVYAPTPERADAKKDELCHCGYSKETSCNIFDPTCTWRADAEKDAALTELLESARDYVVAFTHDKEDGHIAKGLVERIDAAILAANKEKK